MCARGPWSWGRAPPPRPCQPPQGIVPGQWRYAPLHHTPSLLLPPSPLSFSLLPSPLPAPGGEKWPQAAISSKGLKWPASGAGWQPWVMSSGPLPAPELGNHRGGVPGPLGCLPARGGGREPGPRAPEMHTGSGGGREPETRRKRDAESERRRRDRGRQRKLRWETDQRSREEGEGDESGRKAGETKAGPRAGQAGSQGGGRDKRERGRRPWEGEMREREAHARNK